MGEIYVVLVSGWRHATTEAHHRIIREALRPIYIARPGVVLRHGQCPYGGVDLIADDIATQWHWEVDRMPAEVRGGRILGPARNRAMCAKTPRPDELVAFPGPGSTGTLSCIKEAIAHGIPGRFIPLAGGTTPAGNGATS